MEQSHAGTERITLQQADQLCRDALAAAGASAEVSASLAAALVEAESLGQRNVGLAHLPDHLAAMADGRIDPSAVPVLSRPAPAIILSDAKGGIAQLGFDRALPDLAQTAMQFGLAIFCQRNAFTCGALGLFALRLARHGLVSLAATNGPALMTAPGAAKPVYCTNPLAFAAPATGGPPLLIDQSSSATAFVNVRRAAKEGRSLPEDWAVNSAGQPTTDPTEAIAGALLTFGGSRGANIALMVEVLAAGLSGAHWSLDAPPFNSGAQNPGSGLFVLAIRPDALAPDFAERLANQLERLSGHGIHIPGRSKGEARDAAVRDGMGVEQRTLERIRAFTRDRTTR